MKTLKIFVSQILDITHFEELIITALEGGSNYWYHIKSEDLIKLDNTVREKYGNKSYPEVIANELYTNPEFSLNIYDDENLDELLGTITQNSLLEGIKMCHKDYPNVYYDFIEGTGDASTADVIFQLAVMEKLVFG